MLGKARLVLVRIVKVISGVLVYRHYQGLNPVIGNSFCWHSPQRSCSFSLCGISHFGSAGNNDRRDPTSVNFQFTSIRHFLQSPFFFDQPFQVEQEVGILNSKHLFFLIKTCSPTVTLKPTRPHFEYFWFDIRL